MHFERHIISDVSSRHTHTHAIKGEQLAFWSVCVYILNLSHHPDFTRRVRVKRSHARLHISWTDEQWACHPTAASFH